MRRIPNDYILIKVDQYENKVGELYRAEQWKTLPNTGVVLGVGSKINIVKVGDHVEFKRFASIDGRTEGERWCKPEHILEVING